MYAQLLALPRVDAPRWNFSAYADASRNLVLGIVASLLYIHAFTLAWALGYELPVSIVMEVGFGALFILLGGLLGQTEPMWVVGNPTPWTLQHSTGRVCKAT